MARKHSTDLILAIETLAQAGKNAGEIQRTLAAGDYPGLDPVAESELPRRTIQHHAARARRELKLNEAIPDDRVEAVTALETRMLRIVKRDIDRIEDRSRRSGLTIEDSRTLKEHHKTIASIREARRREQQNASKHPDKKRGAESKGRQQASASQTITARVQQEMERRRREEPVATGEGLDEPGSVDSDQTQGEEMTIEDHGDPASLERTNLHDPVPA